jgi:glycosyltransferase involved in cell wall biosynthesis
VRSILRHSGNFEIRVHDDGSADGTTAELRAIRDDRLHVSSGPNKGRAFALASAVTAAAGKFTMVFDDDDLLWPEGLDRVLADCAGSLPAGTAGFVYHLVDEAGALVGSEFPEPRSNFLRLRNDLKVKGDKKEVVLTEIFRPIVQANAIDERRIPTSLYWTNIALKFDVLCINVAIGTKNYLDKGMSDRISRLKRANPRSMAALYRTHLKGYFKGRYASHRSALRALAGFIAAKLQTFRNGIRRSAA